MRINAHAHIFNLYTVLSEQAVRILIGRLEDEGVPGFLVEAIEEFLIDHLAAPEFLREEDVLRILLKKVGRHPGFDDFLGRVPDDLRSEIRLIGEAPIDELGASFLRSMVSRFAVALARSDDDARKSNFFDIVDMLRLSLRPEPWHIADEYLDHMGEEDALVALMMDITAGDPADDDAALFDKQLIATSRAARIYPGRVLPFVAVTPQRSNYLDLMDRAIQQMGFVGIKLYPSLGYAIDSPAMDEVYRYSLEHDVPILVHCTEGGFYASRDDIDNSDPKEWAAVLERFPDLRVCLAHFGGATGLIGEAIAPDSWTATVCDLIEAHPNVYTDVACHVDMMKGGTAEAQYFANLKRLLNTSPFRRRILFGTDAWLVRTQLTDEHFWRYFQARLTAHQFVQMSEVTPRQFLGLPRSDGQGARPNIKRYAHFIAAHSGAVGHKPSPWLAQLIEATVGGVTFTVQRVNPHWSRNNEAHFRAHAFFASEQMYRRHRALRFDEAGYLRLRQMQYWNKEHEAPSIFREKCLDLAENVDTHVRINGATGENGASATHTINEIAAFVADGDKTLAETGAFIDALYQFRHER